ncbi:GH36-type glycosyl hydrolase domain-containing protein [Novilysobacter avium]|uniref:Cyclic beta 1-2 glucan synthetase n=1 Tax=Novilysobacter avium TaxID=2781023 RepID=A0A7S6ZUA2_9GAMM|nr:glucoamylase family protein [Lysobacter avium]QOW21845.1 cyclic beta 1-2 glucan synthetase [Lysobacter avium]
MPQSTPPSDRKSGLLRRFARRPQPVAAVEEPPLRDSLFSAQRMEEHGRHLAAVHQLQSASEPHTESLLERLSDNRRLLDHTCTMLTESAQANRRITPASDWLLDNIYLVQEQIAIARRHLPRGYSRELPRLANGPSAGLPRVYDIALNAISHGDGRLEIESLARFVAAYQEVAPLKLGELWAIPIMLRLALIENLRRVGLRIAADRVHMDLADIWADRLTTAAEKRPKDLVLVIADMARSQPPMTPAFVAELVRQVQGQGSVLALALTWVEQWLADGGTDVEQIVHADGQTQSSDQMSVGNSISSLRFLTLVDWQEFVESASLVDAVLRQDPTATYSRMDFATRDRYRHLTEEIARRGRLEEIDVAKKALELARQSAAQTKDIRSHVGFYLADDGRATLEHALGARPTLEASIRKGARRVPLLAYMLPIALIVAFFTQGLVVEAARLAISDGLLLLIGLLGVVAFSELGVACVNWGATLLATPRTLPRMDYSTGIPASARTVVTVPTMLSSIAAVSELVEALEVRFLANRDPQLRFVLLSDFLDAPEQVMPGDEALLTAARTQIAALNERYANGHDLFFLLHRPRAWNPREGVWMGYERKRGKLSALNRVLRGGTRAAFMEITGDIAELEGVRYVITLDSDTDLPRDAARKLVGTLAHPLNHPVFDLVRGVVTRGYGILQPRVGINMSGEESSWYARLFGSEPGIDPYTRAVSDVYQDLFNEGSYVGKGIYDVDAFERALDGRILPNRVLSHDLLEGCYARAGVVSDVQLYEQYPSRYAVDVKRRQRWIRGDWQLLPWLLPWVQRAGRKWERNPLSMLSRGKLVDNLRRSLVPAAVLALLLIGWFQAKMPLAWTLWIFSIYLIPPLLASIVDFARRPPDLSVRAHLRQAAFASLRSFVHAPLAVACLAYEAAFSLAAIGKTLWRLATRRHLLQWNPSSEVARSLPVDALATVRSMWTAPVVAIVVGVALALVRPGALLVAAPVLLAWFASPWLMWWLGSPRAEPATALTQDQLQFLRRLARRTWAFFDSHVTAQDHWLPPDNVQEYPALVVARRTSPTNIGLSLLADLAAWDFGYVTTATLMERVGGTLGTMQALPRYRGHFFNWYDTQTLQPLPPRYISAVDSGNLSGHLLTLRQGLLAMLDAPVVTPVAWQGVADTLDVLRESLGDVPTVTAIAAMSDELDAAMATPPATLGAAAALAHRLHDHAEQVRQHAAGSEASAYWADALQSQCNALAAELAWMSADAEGNASSADNAASGAIPSLRELTAHASPAIAGQARDRITELERLAHIAGQCAQAEFGFLYDPARRLLVIGYNVDEQRCDNGYYDLLASEARLGSFVAIAQGQLPQETWFALGRLLTEVDGDPTLLSWSGSMFEYLMPQLVMPSYRGTLLDQTARNSVDRQIEYGRQRGVPWGISESGYQLFDARMNYQYRAFGVPGLGLKRGLAQDLVIAPYASMMALMVAPQAATENLRVLTRKGFTGRFGLYEAIDYTPARLPPGKDHVVVRSFMVHHQGMGLLALDYLLRDQPMQRRFMADPELQATLLLLQERIPRTGMLHPHAAEAASAGKRTDQAETRLRIFRTPNMELPAIQMLSNGSYHVMVGCAGGGYSRTDDIAVTRWREDAVRDHWGSFCYVRDVDDGDFWSTSYQPSLVAVDAYEAIFSDAKAEFRGRRRDFEMHTAIAVSPEDDIELRRLRIANRASTTRTVEITTYAEVVLAPAIADELHPAFSNLFVQTELDRGRQAILCTRRRRELDETPPWMFHLVAVHDASVDAISYETDRSRFIGRGNTLQSPDALTTSDQLSGSEGSVLDPIVAIRCRITLAPGQVASIDMVSGVSPTRGDASGMIDKYRDRGLADRVFDMAWTHSQVVRNQINATQIHAQLYERLAGLVLYTNSALRAEPALLRQNRRGQSGLWGQSISGDLPIVLVKIADVANIELVRQLAQAHAYWRLKGLVVDLVIWNEDQAGYRQQLQDQVLGLIAAGAGAHLIDRPGGIFVRPTQQMSQEDRILMQAVARVVLSDRRGSLAEQLEVRPPAPPLAALLGPAPEQYELMPRHAGEGPAPRASFDAWPFDPGARELILDNGIGGFSPDGREYVIDLVDGQTTPAPWSNVMANAQFGCVVSESSPGYTWGENAHEFRLTPWHNDPVSDPAGEAFYLRDEDTGHVWSPTPLPCRGTGPYRTRHGFGYSVYEHEENGIISELWVYVDLHDAVKFSVLKLANRSGRPRRLSATGYVEWILGDLHGKTGMHVITEIDGDSGVLTARNPYNTEFEGRVAFFDTDAGADERSITGDRLEFIGRNGTLQAPAGLTRERLSGQIGAGLDPVAAIQVPITLEPGERNETVFRLGMGEDWGECVAVARRHRGNDAAHDALDRVRMYWLQTLGAIQVDTPEPAFDVLANGWLMYQTIACRFLARSGYYQSGGAYGFRDQLQDSMSMVHAEPAMVRSHLLRSAAHQFPEGDVLHWWHPPQDRGVRTRCSDDYLWLPLAVCRYVEATGDRDVLEEPVSYIEGRPVAPGEESYFDLPLRSTLRQSLYQHCVRSIRRGLELTGERGLPLIATGDWNDGMNRVGERGRGESVWLGFFLYDVLQHFAPLAEAHLDHRFAAECLQAAETLQQNLEKHAWDGEWYQRAWFDNGAPLGSKDSDECRIDSISQSWAVLSGAGDPQRTTQAMASLDEHLVREEAGLIQLLDPPFDKTAQDPGYIRGYVPGVRENGGQYTHSAVWATMAFARSGHTERAWELMRMINPVNHGAAASLHTYKVEPYVMAADVYAVPPHVGRGGWTWYTGSSGWMYRLMVESLLGIRREGSRLHLDPTLPNDWPGFQMRYRYGDTEYRIEVSRDHEGDATRLLLDGVAQADLSFRLLDDQNPREVQVFLADGPGEALDAATGV